MIDALASPFTDAFADFRQSVTVSCLLCSPYITQGPVRALVQSLQERQMEKSVQVRVLTDISPANLLQGATDIDALLHLHEHLRHVEVIYLPRVHAKVFVADQTLAIVGSANFTDGGSYRNREYGLRVREATLIAQISADMTRYASLGSAATEPQLRLLQQQVAPLREAYGEAQKALRQTLPKPAAKRQQALEDDLIRLRVQGRSVNAVFSKTLLYILSDGPMATPRLNAQVQQMNPDLCDDAIDRVIDGTHYGKKWKHQVRGAQVSLARQGRIVYDKATGLWQATSEGGIL